MTTSNSIPQQPTHSRDAGLGDLHILPDYILWDIFNLLNVEDLKRCLAVSPVFYIFASDEEIWMHRALERWNGNFHFKGTWKWTALAPKELPKDTILPPTITFNGIESFFFYTKWCRSNMNISQFIPETQHIPRFRLEEPTNNKNEELYSWMNSFPSISKAQWFENFDEARLPVMLINLCKNWTAFQNWDLEALSLANPTTEFRISSNFPKKVRMTLDNYKHYISQQHDEVPLYIFDSHFGETIPSMLSDYDIPSIFTEHDFLSRFGKERPDYRWVVIGPPRSGASWHIDPTNTSAWNALIHGRKRWALYPPGHIPPGIDVQMDEKGDIVDFDSPSSLIWYLEVYPHLSASERPLECIQYPGDTIFVPAGWWHMVLNLDYTCAVTQNFLNKTNLEGALSDLRHHSYYKEFLTSLATDYPDLLSNQLFSERVLVQERVRSLSQLKRSMSSLSQTWKQRVATVLYKHDLLKSDRNGNGNGNGNEDGCPLKEGELIDTDLIPNDFNIKHIAEGENCVFQHISSGVYIKFYSFETRKSEPFEKELRAHLLLENASSSLKSVFPKILGYGHLFTKSVNDTNMDPSQAFEKLVYPSNSFSTNSSVAVIRQVNGHHFKEESNSKAVEEISHDESTSSSNSDNDDDNNNNDHDNDNGNDNDNAQLINTNNSLGPVVWNWPYIILSNIEGVPLDVSDPDLVNLDSVVDFLATTLKELQSIPISISNSLNGNSDYSELWAPFKATMQKRIDSCFKKQSLWFVLSQSLLSQLPAFLPPSADTLLDVSNPPCLLHGDLHAENLMGIVVTSIVSSNDVKSMVVEKENGNDDDDDDDDEWEDIEEEEEEENENRNEEILSKNVDKKKRNGKTFHPCGILDFGDSDIGDPLVDIIPLYMSVFKCDKKLLSKFLSKYNPKLLKQLSSNSSEGLAARKRAMWFLLLHPVNALLGLTFYLPEALEVKTLEEMTELLWKMDGLKQKKTKKLY